MSARDAIFTQIRRKLGGARADAARIAAEARALTEDAAAIQPDFSHQDNAARFIEKATSERVTAQLERLNAMEDVPAAAARYLENAGAARLAVQPVARLQALDWAGIDIHDAPAPNETAAISLAEFGVAETGSVVFRSGPDCPVLFSFFPLHHIVVLEGAAILRHIEDLWAALREEGAAHPRNINIVTGTSGTADIEAKNIRGAHGPRYMQIYLIDQKSAALSARMKT